LATSVKVKCVFSRGRLLLSHIQNHMSAQTTCAVLCLGKWSLMGLIQDNNVMKVAALPEV
ncbi:hypothetical protein B0H34DRAFT_635791, partial [Crassisporium funariophilum]